MGIATLISSVNWLLQFFSDCLMITLQFDWSQVYKGAYETSDSLRAQTGLGWNNVYQTLTLHI